MGVGGFLDGAGVGAAGIGGSVMVLCLCCHPPFLSD